MTHAGMLWFAEKFVSLLIEQHPLPRTAHNLASCDLLKNSYLCLLNNTMSRRWWRSQRVVICWKIRIFAYWTTPRWRIWPWWTGLWFAEKFVSLLIEQHPWKGLLPTWCVVICWKIRIFAYWTTPASRAVATAEQLWFAEKFVSLLIEQHLISRVTKLSLRCDLLKNSYLCLLNNTRKDTQGAGRGVVICWKIRIFAYWTTPKGQERNLFKQLWFAEKFVSLLIEQHQHEHKRQAYRSCDLLKNSYLCLLNNTLNCQKSEYLAVVICWKIRIFAYWTTPKPFKMFHEDALWFAEKFVSLLIEQHPASG